MIDGQRLEDLCCALERTESEEEKQRRSGLEDGEMEKGRVEGGKVGAVAAKMSLRAVPPPLPPGLCSSLTGVSTGFYRPKFCGPLHDSLSTASTATGTPALIGWRNQLPPGSAPPWGCNRQTGVGRSLPGNTWSREETGKRLEALEPARAEEGIPIPVAAFPTVPGSSGRQTAGMRDTSERSRSLDAGGPTPLARLKRGWSLPNCPAVASLAGRQGGGTTKQHGGHSGTQALGATANELSTCACAASQPDHGRGVSVPTDLPGTQHMLPSHPPGSGRLVSSRLAAHQANGSGVGGCGVCLEPLMLWLHPGACLLMAVLQSSSSRLAHDDDCCYQFLPPGLPLSLLLLSPSPAHL